jgi:hypothetical protein
MYLTFTPSKGSTIVPKLVKCLAIVIDVLLLLLMVWTIVNMCYPFWGWIIYASTWVGFVSYAFFAWIFRRCRIRSFTMTRFCPGDKLMSNGLHDLKHLGFLFSVWEKPDALVLGTYNRFDQVVCLRKRRVFLGHSHEYSKWLGWLIVLSTNTIPFVLLAALLCAGYFLSVGTIIFFFMGLLLAWQVRTVFVRFAGNFLWEDKLLLDGKMCTRKFLGIMTCVMEGSEGGLFLTMLKVVLFDHYEMNSWFELAAVTHCQCCRLLMDPTLLSLKL